MNDAQPNLANPCYQMRKMERGGNVMLNQASIYEACGPNVEAIRLSGTRIVRGSIPAVVRAELREGVRLGQIGRLPRKGHAPEVFFNVSHPHPYTAERMQREAIESAKKLLSKIFIGIPVDA